MAIRIWVGIVAGFLILGLIGGQMNYAEKLNTLTLKHSKLATVYKEHLYNEYAMSICGVILSGPRATDRTDKDKACLVGIEEKLRREVEAISK